MSCRIGERGISSASHTDVFYLGRRGYSGSQLSGVFARAELREIMNRLRYDRRVPVNDEEGHLPFTAMRSRLG